MEKAIKLYRQAAEAGLAGALHNLGRCYFNGQGVEKDLAKAKVWCAKAAKQGNAKAMNNLAGVLQDMKGRAAYPAMSLLLRTAAEKGYAGARQTLPQLEEAIRQQCGQCGKDLRGATPPPSVCGGCGGVAYCSRACAKKHWKKGGHKQACKAAKQYLPEEEEE